MYPISNTVKVLFEAEQKQILRITGTDKNGVAISITDADLLLDSFNIDRFSCNGEKLEIGTATSAQLELKLNNANGQFNDIIFEGSELFVEIGIGTPVNWIPCGYFTPDEQPRKLTTISIKALDRMVRLDTVAQAYPWTDNNGNKITDNNGNIIYFVDALTFPCTVESLIQQIAGNFIPFTQDLSSLPNYNMTINALPELTETITFRNIIQWCAGLMGTNAYIDWNGNLCFSWYSNTTEYVSITANRFDSDLYENALTITGVEFTDTDENKTVYLAGSDEYSIELTGNPFINSNNASTILQNVYYAVRNLEYTPFNASVISAPYLWPMDKITFTDKNGNSHNSVLTNVSFGLNGSTSLASIGMTMQLNSSVQSSGFTAQQIQEIRKIQHINLSNLQKAVDDATTLITGADGGYVRFIYDGDILTEIVIMDTDDIETATKVWRWNSGGLGYSSNGYNGPYTLAMTQNGAIVADFITTGTLSADIIKAGVLGDAANKNYWNMLTGAFSLSGNASLNGTSVTDVLNTVNATITNVDVEYAQNQSTTVAPTSGWSTTAPAWQEGYYIWQRTATTTSAGTTYSAATCISGKNGEDGTSVTILGSYNTLAELEVAHPTGNIGDGYLVSGYLYVWDGAAWSNVGQIQGPQGATGPQGPQGVGIASVTEYYALNNSTTAPGDSSFSTSVKTPTAANKYVWNYELITYTDNTTSKTAKHIAATYGDTGATGNGISSIVEYYAVNNSTTAPSDSAFSTTISAPTVANKYLWNYEQITYTDGSTVKTGKRVIGTYGEKGDTGSQGATGIGVSAVVEQYYLSTSSTTQSGGSWSTNQPAWVSGEYIWTRSQITWTDLTITYTSPVLAKAINGANSTAYSASSAVSTLDNSLDQRGVFNRLTNGGQAEGIYLNQGNLYINASYIKSGTLVIGGNNNVNGNLQVLDANGNVIGTWNKDGIRLYNGYIEIPITGNNGNGYVSIGNGSYPLSSRYTDSSTQKQYTQYFYGERFYIGNITDNIYTYYFANRIYMHKALSGAALSIFLQDDVLNKTTELSVDNGIRFKDNTNNLDYYLNVSGFSINRGTVNGYLNVTGNFTANGTKSRRVTTAQYSDRLLYCYETPSPMFGDIGEGVIGEDGLCYVTIDPVFAQTITTDRYQVFLQPYGEGTCFINKRYSGYFIVQGTPEMAFGWEIKAKQRDFDQRRLDSAQEPYTPEHKDYGTEAAQYIAELKKEREAA